MSSEPNTTVNPVVIIGSGPAAHTAAIYLGRALLHPVVLEGFLANGIAAGGQLTTTTEIENFPGFLSISGSELTEKFREQGIHNGATVITETVTNVDFSVRPFVIYTDTQKILATSVIIATGAVAKRLPIKGADEQNGYWNRGISACAVCDGAAPIFRNNPVFVIGGGDSAIEEAMFLSRYASSVTVVHRRDTLRASKIMQTRAAANPKIQFVMNSEVVECLGDGKRLTALQIKNDKNEIVTQKASGLFFAVGHEPATTFLQNQIQLDSDGYIVVNPGTAETNIKGVFAAGDVADKRWRQAITAAGSGCIAALQVEQFLAHELGP